MRLNKHTVVGLGMRLLGKGLHQMGKQEMKKGKVIDIESGNEGREVRLILTQIKNLLDIKATEFAQQYVDIHPEYPEYMMDDDFGGKIIDNGIARLIQMQDWGTDEMLELCTHCFLSVITDKLEFLYPDDGDDGDDEDDEDDEGDEGDEGDTIDEETE